MMAALRHPNVVAFLGVCADPPCVATEYCGRGSLTDVLRGGKNSPVKAKQLDWARRLNMVRFCGWLCVCVCGGVGEGQPVARVPGLHPVFCAISQPRVPASNRFLCMPHRKYAASPACLAC